MSNYKYMTDTGKAMSNAGYWDHKGYGGGIVPQAIDPYSYEAGTLQDAPLGTGGVPLWLLAGSGAAAGYGLGLGAANWRKGTTDTNAFQQVDRLNAQKQAGILKEQQVYEDMYAGPTAKHARKLATMEPVDVIRLEVPTTHAEMATESGLKMALDDKGYPYILNTLTAGGNSLHQNSWESPIAGPATSGWVYPEGFWDRANEGNDSITGYEAAELANRAERIREAKINAGLTQDQQDYLYYGAPLAGDYDLDLRGPWEEWRDSFKEGWRAR